MSADMANSSFLADPLADDTIAKIIGPWPDADMLDAEALARIGLVNRLMSTWGNNASLPKSWKSSPPSD